MKCKNTLEKELVLAGLIPMIKEAREKKLFLYNSYYDLWFSPKELEDYNSEDRYVWGAVNWHLKDPAIYLKQLGKNVQKAKDEHWNFLLRIGKAETE